MDDGNAWNCLRVTVDHGFRSDLEEAHTRRTFAGAAIWVRVGSDLKTPADVDAWRKQFDATRVRVIEISERRTRIELPGRDGPLSITADAP